MSNSNKNTNTASPFNDQKALQNKAALLADEGLKQLQVQAKQQKQPFNLANPQTMQKPPLLGGHNQNSYIIPEKLPYESNVPKFLQQQNGSFNMPSISLNNLPQQSIIGHQKRPLLDLEQSIQLQAPNNGKVECKKTPTKQTQISTNGGKIIGYKAVPQAQEVSQDKKEVLIDKNSPFYNKVSNFQSQQQHSYDQEKISEEYKFKDNSLFKQLNHQANIEEKLYNNSIGKKPKLIMSPLKSDLDDFDEEIIDIEDYMSDNEIKKSLLEKKLGKEANQYDYFDDKRYRKSSDKKSPLSVLSIRSSESQDKFNANELESIRQQLEAKEKTQPYIQSLQDLTSTSQNNKDLNKGLYQYNKADQYNLKYNAQDQIKNSSFISKSPTNSDHKMLFQQRNKYQEFFDQSGISNKWIDQKSIKKDAANKESSFPTKSHKDPLELKLPKSKTPMGKDYFYNKLGMSVNAPVMYPTNQLDITHKDRIKDEQEKKELQKAIYKKFGKYELEKKKREQEELNKQKEQERQDEEKQKQLKQKKEKNDFFNDLFDNNTDQGEKNDQQTEDNANSLLKNLMINGESQPNINQYNNRRTDNDQGNNNCSKEERRQMLEMINEKKREEERKILRYHNRKNVEEIIKPILSLQLINMFYSDKKRPSFKNLPLKFESHEQYRNLWTPLFLYEVYNSLINHKSGQLKEKEIAESQGLKYKSKQTYFEGFIQSQHVDPNYCFIKLYEAASNTPDKEGQYNHRIIDSLKEFDLLLLSKDKLEINEVKKITSTEYLAQLKNDKTKMMSIVHQRRKNDTTYITLKVDCSHEEFLTQNVGKQTHFKIHVYFFESLSTTVREFRTIKSCEFFPTSEIIIDPQLLNQLRQQEDDVINSEMNEFIESKKKNFNQSQLNALNQVAKMKEKDFLLIQGPPGTGKTHTIQGILSMLVDAKVNKILVCAPSNAAIDEIVLRLSTQGLHGVLNQAQLKEKILRIGALDYDPLPEVRKHTLDERIKEEMGQNQNGQKLSNTNNAESNIKVKQGYITTINNIVSNGKESTDQSRMIACLKNLYDQTEKVQKFLKKSKQEKLECLAILKENYQKLNSKLANQEVQVSKKKDSKKDIEKSIIERAQIICTTLSLSACEKLELIKFKGFEYLIVDEACQCVELANLIPFEHEPQKIILVGDQQQLPATTFSDNSERTKYSRSLFERFLECGVDRFMLNIQYRMHPQIRKFPSDRFYDGKLEDAKDVTDRYLDKEQFPNILNNVKQSMGNLMFFDLKYAQEQNKETSKSNLDEASFILALYSDLVKNIAKSNEYQSKGQDKAKCVVQDLRGRIGIITPYKSQVRTLKDHLFPKLRSMNCPLDCIEINTVDAYQGREKDIIIISCVRGSQDKTLGFLNDYRRMNVAITRAKHFLWVVGNSDTLDRNSNWSAFLDYIRSQENQQCMIQIRKKDDWQDGKLMSIVQNAINNKPQQFETPQKVENNNDGKNSRKHYESNNWRNEEQNQGEGKISYENCQKNSSTYSNHSRNIREYQQRIDQRSYNDEKQYLKMRKRERKENYKQKKQDELQQEEGQLKEEINDSSRNDNWNINQNRYHDRNYDNRLYDRDNDNRKNDYRKNDHKNYDRNRYNDYKDNRNQQNSDGRVNRPHYKSSFDNNDEGKKSRDSRQVSDNKSHNDSQYNRNDNSSSDYYNKRPRYDEKQQYVKKQIDNDKQNLPDQDCQRKVHIDKNTPYFDNSDQTRQQNDKIQGQKLKQSPSRQPKNEGEQNLWALLQGPKK